MFGEFYYEITFVNDSDKETFRLPQCKCGKLAREYYEFKRSDEDTSGPYVVEIICKKCLHKYIEEYE